MKKIVLSLLAFSAFGTSIQAQTRFEKAAEDAAIVICETAAAKSVADTFPARGGSSVAFGTAAPKTKGI